MGGSAQVTQDPDDPCPCPAFTGCPCQPPLPLRVAEALPEADAPSAGPAAGAPVTPGAPGVTLPPHLGSLEEKTRSGT